MGDQQFEDGLPADMIEDVYKNTTYVPIVEFFQRENWYYDLFIKFGDPRLRDSFLLQTPEWTLGIVVCYLLFVFIVPRLMEKREPLNLKSTIIVYNFMMVVLSGFMCVEFFLTSALMGYSYFCQPIDWNYPTDALSLRMVFVNWLFFFSKIIELTDTVFFILRKNNHQVTFLHVYHHATMIINWWMAAKYCPVGQSFFVGMVNSFIHTLMYTYYALAALGPEMQKYLWWKKYMTTMQLVQFVLVMTHTGYNKFLYPGNCDYPWLFNTITFYYTISMFVLFSNFYYRTYVSRSTTMRTQKTCEKQSVSYTNTQREDTCSRMATGKSGVVMFENDQIRHRHSDKNGNVHQ